MPIGVPRIIYCWGEELPAQWTDIYNFIFRRRMVFLMQYLDDELCNQICGLLINIHMEDRSKELEKKEMENSGLFKTPSSQKQTERSSGNIEPNAFSKPFIGKKEKSIEDLMISEEDLAIDENHMLERHTLQKISLEWLNWNAQFFDYSEEPYLFYLAELLARDFTSDDASLLYNNKAMSSPVDETELSRLMMMFKNMTNSGDKFDSKFFDTEASSKSMFDVYSAFRLLANFTSQDYKDFQLDARTKNHLIQKFNMRKMQSKKNGRDINNTSMSDSFVNDMISEKAQTDLFAFMDTDQIQNTVSEKALAQRQLRRGYSREKNRQYHDSHRESDSLGDLKTQEYTKTNLASSGSYNMKAASYLNLDASDEAYSQYRDYYRKQTERVLQEEESKKVFMIINSFGGSVGNGITVHDALQFIKAGSMTLALGVAASAASLALAGGTIGERYVTEGCHVMIHQPEGGLTGQASDIWIDSQEIMKIRLDVAEIYSLSTYRPRHKILRDLDRDFYLTATETIYYGLADEIATNEVMHEIIEMTSKVWDYHDSQQQKLLESRESATAGLDTQTQN
uniref:ATP-dependent Clp protease proteolytic subunit n=1 Tax=Bracteacoccus giganteus TaxID=50039 RepID=A0A0S2LQM6_9CHLO|nr:proteolytic subunit 2 of clp protease [Bracteacoccus giganteus]ALO63497.1 proteolytic subunit 2 of clp protease [Bracteacoccus giganteus]